MLAADYGDAATSNGQAYGSASHEAVGPILGSLRDANNLITNSLANGDRQDEDGVAFGFLRAGQTGSITVYVIDAPAGAKLDAWIDFSRDANFSTPGDQVVDDLPVSAGENFVSVNIPASVSGGYYHARVRLSTAGNLAPTGAATNGEVEDYVIAIAHAESGIFGGQQALSFIDATQAIPTDLDSDGDLDLLTSRTTWFENQSGRFGGELQHTGSTALAVAPADIDRDGDMDYFANVSGNLYWYANNGTQTFTPRQISSNAPAVLNPVDLDNDGDVDLYGTTAWFRNNGSQSFTRIDLSPAQSGEQTTTVDMDGDGDRDVVVASTSQGTLQWLENDGGESFTTRSIATIGITLRAVTAADVDDDGDIDVVTASGGNGGGVTWYENDGAHSFTSHALDVVGWSSEAVVLSDLDADGDLDIAASGSGRVAWYENDGAKSFAFRMIVASPGSHAGIMTGDLDGDGRLDLVTAGTFDAPIGWYRQFAEYDYGDAPHPYRVHLQDNGARHNAVGPMLGSLRDAEADGAHAPASAEAEDDGVAFRVIEISQGFGVVTVNVHNAPAGAKLDAWIDFNGDGAWAGGDEQIFTSLAVSEGDNALTFAIPSTAIPGATAARFRLSTAGGLGTFGAAFDGEVEDHQVTLVGREQTTGLFTGPNLIGGGGGAFTVSSDIDGDGDVDVVSSGGRVWYENQGATGFVSHIISSTGVGGEDFAADDLDGDGDVDIIGFRSDASAALAWLENDGAQNFTLRFPRVGGTLNPMNAATASSIVDIDGDGDRDILACDLFRGVYLFLNNGQQQFSTRFLGIIGQYATSVVAADIDGDGDLDVVAGGADSIGDSSVVFWFQNDGTLTFTVRTVKAAPPSSGTGSVTVESVAVGDMDGDGDLDVVAAGVSSGSPNIQYLTLSWHEQLVDNKWVEHQIDFNRNLRWATLADFDADGDFDILASGYTGSIDLYDNVGAQKFVRRQISPAQNAAMSVAVADIDGDGHLDIVAPGVLDVGLAWFRNVPIQDPDYGDAPAPYLTARAGGGAVHNGGGPRLGASRTSEADGVPSATADGDSGDDGVAFSPIQIGQALATVTVNVQNAPAGARLDAWIDFNGDGSWGGAGEQIFGSCSVVEGDNVLTFNVPANVVVGAAVARFRLSTAGGLRDSGAAIDGEVEDYLLAVSPPAKATGEYLVGVPIGSGPSYNTPSPAQAIHVADIDGDGDADYLATAPDAWPRLAWYENLGDGAFLMHVRRLTDAPSVWGARPLDLDGDGDVDFAVVVSNGIGWFENDGSQNFAYHAAIATGNSFSGVVDFADVDGDGDLDALAARAALSTQSLVILLNDGQQRFTPAATLTTLNVGASAIRAADIDRDGDIDFAVTFEGSSAQGGVAWYENDGAWTLHDVTRNAPTEPSLAGRDVVPIDFDFDGDLDLVASTYASSPLSLTLYRNDGAENFVRETLATILSPFDAYISSSNQARGYRLQVADLDGDGDYDAVIASYRYVRLYRNEAATGFVQSEIHEFGAAPYSVTAAVGDVDGDGRLEILASNGRYSVVRLDDRPFGDYDRNGAVDQADRDLYEATLGQPAVPPGFGADGDRSGVVDAADLAIWEANQGAAPTPLGKAADLDQNERIDGADFLLWQRAFGATSTYPGTHWADVDNTTTIDGGDLAVWKRQFGQGVAPPAPAAALTSSSVSSATASTTAMVISSAELESTPATSSPSSPLPSAPASRFALPASVILAAPPEKPAGKKPDALHLLKRNATSPRDAAFAALASPATNPLRRQRLQTQALQAAPAGDPPHADVDAALRDECLPSDFNHRVAP